MGSLHSIIPSTLLLPLLRCTVTGIITEEGVCYPPYAVSLRAAKERAEARAKAAWERKLAAVV